MRRRHYSLSLVVLLALVAVLMNPAYLSQRASAASSTSWTLPSGNFKSRVSLAGDGSLLRCTHAGGGSPAVIRGVSAAGVATFAFDSSNLSGGRQIDCLNNPPQDESNGGGVRAAMNGSSYFVSEYDAQHSYVGGFSGAQELWHTEIESDTHNAPAVLNIATGTNGTVYVLAWIANGYDVPQADEYFIEAMDPKSGSKKWRWDFPSSQSLPTSAIYPTLNGVVVATAASAIWVDSQGRTRGQRTIPKTASGGGVTIASTPDGTVVFAVNGDGGGFGGGCSDGGMVGAVRLNSATDKPLWSHSFPLAACRHYFRGVSPLPSGGAVFIGDSTVFAAGPPKNGKSLWWERSETPIVAGSSVAADGAGRVMVRLEKRINCEDPTAFGSSCVVADTQVLDGATGAQVSSNVYAVMGSGAASLSAAVTAASKSTNYMVTSSTTAATGSHIWSLISQPITTFGDPWPRSALLAATTNPGSSQPARYVALGDSFSSGEGAAPYEKISAKNHCDRSLASYSRLVAKANSNLKPSYVACSGAIVADLYLGQNGEAPQLASLSPDTQVVSLTIGGNDITFGSIVSNCVNSVPHSDAECQTAGKANIDATLAQLRNGFDFCVASVSCMHYPALRDLYAEIHRRAPQAKIYILDYPVFFSESASKDCVVGKVAGVSALTVRVENQHWLASAGRELNAAIGQEVEAAASQGVPVTLVDASSKFLGHGLCTSDPWFNGVTMKSVKFWSAKPSSFHPNAAGQASMAASLRAVLVGS